jgi:hypothetical protein
MTRDHDQELTLIYTIVALAIALNFPVATMIAVLLALAGLAGVVMLLRSVF